MHMLDCVPVLYKQLVMEFSGNLSCFEYGLIVLFAVFPPSPLTGL